MVVKKLSKKEIKQHVEDGYIHASVLYEMIGHPKDHIENTMKIFLDNINSDDQIICLSTDMEETVATEGNMFSAAAEVEYLIMGIEKLTWLCFNFMPANIDIRAPKQLTFKEKDFSDWINDLLAKLHEVNTVHTSLKAEHQGLIKSLNAAIRNIIILSLTEPMTSKQIAKNAGLSEKQVLVFLEMMQKEGKIEHKGKKFKKV